MPGSTSLKLIRCCASAGGGVATPAASKPLQANLELGGGLRRFRLVLLGVAVARSRAEQFVDGRACGNPEY